MRTRTIEEKKLLLIEKKKERDRKKGWVVERVENVIRKSIEKGSKEWWSFL